MDVLPAVQLQLHKDRLMAEDHRIKTTIIAAHFMVEKTNRTEPKPGQNRMEHRTDPEPEPYQKRKPTHPGGSTTAQVRSNAQTPLVASVDGHLPM